MLALVFTLGGRLLFIGWLTFGFGFTFWLIGRFALGCIPRLPCGGFATTFAGGATRTAATFARGCSMASCRVCAMEIGRPWLALMASWRCANEGGGGGGAVLATTVRDWSAAGGWKRAGALAPKTACFEGTAAGARTATGAEATSR